MDSKLIPCDEGLAREIVAGLQGVVFSKGIDAKTVPLENVFAPVNYARALE